MNTGKLFFIFIALFITLAHCSTIKGDGNDDSNVIVVVPTTGLKIIQTVVGVLTDVGIKGIDAITINMGKIEEKVHKVEKQLIDSLWGFVEKKLDDVTTDANSFTKMAIECLRGEAAGLKGMVYNFSSQLVSCEIEKTVMNLNSYRPILTDVKSTNDKMKDYIEQLGNCGNDGTAVACINKVEAQMEKEMTELINIVTDNLADAQVIQEHNEKVAALCHEDATNKLTKNSMNVASIVSKCIDDHYVNNAIVKG